MISNHLCLGISSYVIKWESSDNIRKIVLKKDIFWARKSFELQKNDQLEYFISYTQGVILKVQGS